ncbi:anti-sigma factor domain-containing protein [Kitasatospora sp. A2-31]|uniref:anti-sigma factor n=1 Tax=Kitasatospora sp. A2-31 TaxID=2916414 RepID=UPI001EEBB45E|nr:anti-sigma factor [Kitasatospora sp. A2-31]MCG6498392.1 anti-sigma factor [Kitasatospora sp. A2-31]
MSTADLHTLTGAYAAHALDTAEREEFERHLARCPACAQEVAEFTATLARLGAAQAVPVPGELKARVMAALDTVRQDPPSSPPSAPRTLRGRLRRSWPRYALAACLALAAAAGAVAVREHDRADRAGDRAAAIQRQQARITDLLTAPDVRSTTAKVAGGPGVATVLWSHDQDTAGFLASGMPALAQGTTYELWFDDGGTMRPAGLMSDASGALLLSGPLNGASGVGVTVEPSGGSARPTGAPVVLLSFG